jgi:hypothetical protein
MRQKTLLILASLIGFLFTAHAQRYLVNDDFNKANGNTSVSKGYDDISIPLLSISFGGERIPISISYQNEPPKYGQLPGLVGHSWNFSFQYHLTRSEKMFEYEIPGSNLNSAVHIYDGDWDNGHQGKDEFDYFRFNAPSGAGSFIYHITEFFSNFDNFTYTYINDLFGQLVDNRGWKYIYGDTLVLDHMLDSTLLSRDKRLNASLLKQIIAPNRDTLTISYGRKEIYSTHKRIEIFIDEPKDIIAGYPGNQDSAMIRIDTLDMGKKYIYYPLYADHSNGDRVNFNYSISDTAILLTSMNYLNRTVSFGVATFDRRLFRRYIYKQKSQQLNLDYG